MATSGDIKKTLYVSDLDGTLLNDQSVLSPGTVATLNRVIGQLGGFFTIATARTPATVVPLMQEVHATLPFIVIGGSAMWNPVTHSYEHTCGIADDTITMPTRSSIAVTVTGCCMPIITVPCRTRKHASSRRASTCH